MFCIDKDECNTFNKEINQCLLYNEYKIDIEFCAECKYQSICNKLQKVNPNNMSLYLESVRALGWYWFMNDNIKKTTPDKGGKWMYFFKENQYIGLNICNMLREEGIVSECKCRDLDFSGDNTGVVCTDESSFSEICAKKQELVDAGIDCLLAGSYNYGGRVHVFSRSNR